MSQTYDIAQICINGHVATKYFQSFPDNREEYCHKCGSKTITHCSECNKPVRGAHLDGFPIEYTAPLFCIHCGNPYPWTKTRLEAAHDIIKELDSLDEVDKATLDENINDLVRDTPNTPVAALRVKKIMAKAGQGFAGALRDILVDIASESAKKVMWP